MVSGTMGIDDCLSLVPVPVSVLEAIQFIGRDEGGRETIMMPLNREINVSPRRRMRKKKKEVVQEILTSRIAFAVHWMELFTAWTYKTLLMGALFLLLLLLLLLLGGLLRISLPRGIRW